MSQRLYTGKGKAGSIAMRNKGHRYRKHISLTNAFVGLWHAKGTINFRSLVCVCIGGDHINDLAGNIYIHKLVVRQNEVWVDYEYYHQDVYQSYATLDDNHTIDVNGVIRNVRIANVDIEMRGPKSQLFMLSEPCGYEQYEIGFESLKIRSDYPYWFRANTLSHSKLGNLNGKVDVQTWDGKQLKVAIGNGIKGSQWCIKPSQHKTHHVILLGCGFNNEVPPNVLQY